jgi:EAL and modified HD-GYP domain-containing signal transduction protein
MPVPILIPRFMSRGADQNSAYQSTFAVCRFLPATMPSQPKSAVLHASPLINAKRQCGGLRIVIDNRAIDENELRDTLALVTETTAEATHPLIVAFADERLPIALSRWRPSANAIPEFRGEWLTLPAARDMLAGGNFSRWCLNGSPGLALDPALLMTLAYTVVAGVSGRATDHSRIAGKARIRTGLRTHADADTWFDQGIDWIAGWPLQMTATRGRKRRTDNRAIVVRLLQLAQSDADLSELEALLKQDVGLAFKLLRYINSAANGLTLEVQSFQHAVMVLGYKPLTRWLSLLLVSAGDNLNQLPLMNLSLRRGFFLERIGKRLFDHVNPDELFMTGLFSLLNIIFEQPFDELVDQLNLPDDVSDSLVNFGGPYGLLLMLAEAIEGDDAAAIRAAIDMLGLDAGEVNRALLLAARDSDLVDLH